jgi:transcriptional regulator with XRE-family HTH domain
MPRYIRGIHGPLPSVVAGRIRAERLRLGLSQGEVAARLGTTRTAYKNLECVANPQLSTLVGLVTVVGMDLDALAPELRGA